MSRLEDDRSLPELLGHLASEASQLFRKEIELAKAELWEKVRGLASAAQIFAIGSVFAVGAIGVLLAAIVSGSAAVLVSLGVQPNIASSLSAVLVAAISGGIAWGLIGRATTLMRNATLNLDRTLSSLSQDAAIVTERFDGER